MSSSAQSPTGPPQPPKEATYTASENPVSRNPPEQACSDTPATSDPYGSGNDYMSYRKPRTDSSAEAANPSPLERGVRGGSGPVDEREARNKGYEYAGHPLRRAEGVDDDDGEDQEKMAPPGEGKVAEAVEGQRDAARREQQQRSGAGGHRGSSAQRHGRIRGEVTLDGEEADYERKKAQQSWDREQVKEARREGKDVDGGSFGARPHAEMD